MSIKKLSFMLLSAMSVAALLNGCGSSNKEGASSPGGVARIDEAQCRVCHSSSVDPVAGGSIVASFVGDTSAVPPVSPSIHYQLPNGTPNTLVGCQGCHGGGAQHNGVGPIPFPNPITAGRCNAAECHNGKVEAGFAASDFVTDCSACHQSTSIHGIQYGIPPGLPAGTTSAQLYNNCVGCHTVGQEQHSPTTVNDNNGVRAITAEFGKWSHHVTGVTLNNAHCTACHLEGKVVNGAVVIDRAFHMADDNIHLRNADTDADFKWNPGSATPNHTNMDNFCMSCHDANGATSPGSAAVQALINTAGGVYNTGIVATALNPFGDTISNQYDQLSRGAVVAVSEQFDGGNTSHHGVRALKYSKKNLVQAELDAIAAANTANGDTVPAVVSAITGTLYETSKLTAYKPFGSSTALADNSQIHCADCHTVGQWKPNTTNVIDNLGAVGAPVPTVIGAHGSNNEYMLRNQDGSDNTTSARLQMVCYICHVSDQYDGYTGTSASLNHNGSMNHSTNGATTNGKATGVDVNCNGNGNNTMGKVLTNFTSSRVGINSVNQAAIAVGKYGTSGSSNPFAIKCINCHNAGVDKNFGGIHGNAIRVGKTAIVNKNVSYYSYSGANGATSLAPQPLSLVARKPYRFMPGLGNFRFNGGADANAWTRKSMGTAGKSERMGCYTLNGASSKRVTGIQDSTGLYGQDYTGSAAPTKAIASGAFVSNNAIATDQSRLIDGASADTGMLGSWGGCAHHAGSSTSITTGLGRTSLRPLTY